MAHPADLYIRYLIAIGNSGKRGMEHINKTLRCYQIMDVTEKELEETAESLRVPPDLMITNKKHTPTREFMQANDLERIWDPDDDHKAMLNLVYTPMVTQTIQILLIGRVPADVVAERINQAYTLKDPMTTEIVKAYEHYFWDYMRVGYDEWNALLFKHPMRDALLSSLTCTPEQALWRAGFNPKVDMKKSLRDCFRTVHFRLEATRSMPDSKDTSEIITKYAGIMLRLRDTMMTDSSSQEEAASAMARSVKIATKPTDIKGIDDISEEGNFSGSGKNN